MASQDSLSSHAVRAIDPELAAGLAAAGLARLESLTARDLGEAVTDHRSSWVRKVACGNLSVFVKTYAYSTWRDRWRGIARTTLFARSRAAREYDALRWLATTGFAGPRPLAVFEQRRAGWLCVAVLVTQAWPGMAGNLDELLPRLTPSEQGRCLEALDRLVERLHAAGFRDRNFDLRNVLARQHADGTFELAKIDSPKFALVRPGNREDQGTRAAYDRVARSLAALQLLPRDQSRQERGALRNPRASAASCPPRDAGTSPRST